MPDPKAGGPLRSHEKGNGGSPKSFPTWLRR